MKVQLPPERINVLRIAGSIWVWILAAFVNFAAVLAVFPAITSLVFSTNYGSVRLNVLS